MKEMRGVPTFDLVLSPMTRRAGVTTGALFSVSKTCLPDGVSPTWSIPANNPLTLREATERSRNGHVIGAGPNRGDCHATS
jgi:hypothetical protein